MTPLPNEDQLYFILIYFDAELPSTKARYTALTRCDDGKIYERTGFSPERATQDLIAMISTMKPKIKSVCIPALEVAGVQVRHQDGQF